MKTLSKLDEWEHRCIEENFEKLAEAEMYIAKFDAGEPQGPEGNQDETRSEKTEERKREHLKGMIRRV